MGQNSALLREPRGVAAAKPTGQDMGARKITAPKPKPDTTIEELPILPNVISRGSKIPS